MVTKPIDIAMIKAKNDANQVPVLCSFTFRYILNYPHMNSSVANIEGERFSVMLSIERGAVSFF